MDEHRALTGDAEEVRAVMEVFLDAASGHQNRIIISAVASFLATWLHNDDEAYRDHAIESIALGAYAALAAWDKKKARLAEGKETVQ